MAVEPPCCMPSELLFCDPEHWWGPWELRPWAVCRISLGTQLTPSVSAANQCPTTSCSLPTECFPSALEVEGVAFSLRKVLLSLHKCIFFPVTSASAHSVTVHRPSATLYSAETFWMLNLYLRRRRGWDGSRENCGTKGSSNTQEDVLQNHKRVWSMYF